MRFKPTLALGSDSNSAPCWAVNEQYRIFNPVGDLTILENLEKFKSIVSMYPKLEIVVCDLHPGFLTAEIAKKIAEKTHATLVRVQHHKAHAASCAYEHRLSEYVAIVCDGLGYGDDGKLWGGEIFKVKNNVFERIGSLQEQIQLGGDNAAIYPEKMLLGILMNFLKNEDLPKNFSSKEIKLHRTQIREGFNIFKTTSTGRVLDSVSALLGVCKKRTYEGEPAIELERFATEPYEIEPIIKKGDRLILDTSSLFAYLLKNMDKDKKRLAATAQMYIAKGVLEIAKKPSLPIVFSGGVAYNKIISGYLKNNGVLLHRKRPPGDPGISLGQAVIANS